MKIVGIKAVIVEIIMLFFLFKNSLARRYAGKITTEERKEFIIFINRKTVFMSSKKYAGEITKAYNGGNFAVSMSCVKQPVSKNVFACSKYARLSEYPNGTGTTMLRRSLIPMRLKNNIIRAFFTSRNLKKSFLKLMDS